MNNLLHNKIISSKYFEQAFIEEIKGGIFWVHNLKNKIKIIKLKINEKIKIMYSKFIWKLLIVIVKIY